MNLNDARKLANEVLAAKKRRDALGAESCRHTIIDEACTIAHHNLVLCRALELAAARVAAMDSFGATSGEFLDEFLEQAEREVGDE